MMSTVNSVVAVFGMFCLASTVLCDTPANCTYEDIRGEWIFQVGSGNNNGSIQCDNFSGPYKRTAKINLIYPDVATDEFGNKGFWTLIYNQGFEVVVAGRKYFAFSKYDGRTSFCHTIMPGWSHDVMGRDWACYNGKKSSGTIIKEATGASGDTTLRFAPKINSEAMVSSINLAQKSWKATVYPQFEGLTQENFVSMAGGRASRILSRPKAAPITEEHKRIMSNLPAAFDWRNVDGINYVSPVRDQVSCGSCYAFASLAMNEARVRVQTNNTQTPVFAPQDIMDCSEYSQGCSGGFPYLIGGKYAEDFGLVEEKCNPYKGYSGSPCTTDPSCARHYSTNYRYVGGYYGGCNEAAMMKAVYLRGPVAIGFEVYNDFMNYKSGIYHHISAKDGFTPFELTNHAVLVVGWGTSEAGEKYWIVKNSWGEDWGQSGYFWIRKGNDECGLESMAMESDPIFTSNA